jgi:hypothetical protein
MKSSFRVKLVTAERCRERRAHDGPHGAIKKPLLVLSLDKLGDATNPRACRGLVCNQIVPLGKTTRDATSTNTAPSDVGRTETPLFVAWGNIILGHIH